MRTKKKQKMDFKILRRLAVTMLCMLSLLITFMPSINAHASSDYHGNAFEFATSLGRLSGLYAEDGGIDFAGDEDYISFVPSSSGTILIYTTGSTDTYGELFNSSHRSLISDDDGNGRGNFKLEYNVSQGSTYYVVIKGYNSRTTGDYELVIELMTSSSDDDDDDISSDNLERRSDIVGDTRSSAYSLSGASRDYEGIFMMNDEDDIDYFSFTPRVSGDLNIYSSGNTDVKGTLYSSSGSSLISDDDSGRGNNFDFTYAVEAGVKYYLKVTGFEEGEYVLNFEYYGNSDNFEYRSDMIGDSRSSAYNLVEASSNYSGLFMINEEGDNDYFKFTPSVTGTVTIYTTGNVDTRGYLYSSSGSSLTNNDDGGSGSNFSITYDVTRNESYYIRVKGYDSDEVGEYGLVFEYEEEVIPLNPNNKEPNGDVVGNLISSAYLLNEASSDYTGYFVMNSSSDNDYFEFVSDYTGTVTIYTESDIDTRGYLYDEDEEKIADNDDVGDDLNFRITCDVERGKTYYLRVKTFSGYEGEYALIFEYDGTTTIDDEDTPGGIISDDSDWTFKGILLYAGGGYEEYLGSQINQLTHQLGSTRLIINMDDIANYTWNGEDIITDDEFDKLIFKDNYVRRNEGKRNLKTEADQCISLLNKLVDSNSNVKVYLTFPSIYYSEAPQEYADVFKSLYEYYRARISSNRWNNNVEGFYFATESIENWQDAFNVSAGYNKNYNNKMFTLMKDLSLTVHNQGKKMLWIPFIGGEDDGNVANRTKIIATIGNQTNVFDYIVVQSGYPFASHRAQYKNYDAAQRYENNAYYIARSAKNNCFMTRDLSSIFCTKTSNTKIGFELEYDPYNPNEWDNNVFGKFGTSLDRYGETLYAISSNGITLKDIPVVYYAGTPENFRNDVFNEIYNKYMLNNNP